jgi:hypothetical protein
MMANLIKNGNLELWNSPTDAVDWQESISGGTINKESVNPHSGTYCMRMDRVTENPLVLVYMNTGTLLKETAYKFGIWMKADADLIVRRDCYFYDGDGNMKLDFMGNILCPYSSSESNFITIVKGDNVWRWYGITFKTSTQIPANSYHLIYCTSGAPYENSLWIDDFELSALGGEDGEISGSISNDGLSGNIESDPLGN